MLLNSIYFFGASELDAIIHTNVQYSGGAENFMLSPSGNKAEASNAVTAKPGINAKPTYAIICDETVLWLR